MNELPTFSASVIIPAYNSAATIRAALNSVKTQSVSVTQQPQVEIVVVDDASTDSTVDVVKEWMEEHGYKIALGQAEGFSGEMEKGNTQHSTLNAQCSSEDSGAELPPPTGTSGQACRTLNTEQSPYGPCFRFLRLARNAGPAAARNYGIASAKGEWIAFLDADDAWLPGKLAVQMEMAAKHPDIAMWCGEVAVFDGIEKRRINWGDQNGGQSSATAELRNCNTLSPQLDLSVRQLSSVTTTNMRLLLLNEFAMGNPVATSTVLARKTAIEEVGGFDEQFRGPEDYDLWMRIVAGHSAARIGIPIAQYNVRSGSLSMDDRRFLPQGMRVLNKAFANGGVFADRPDLRNVAFSNQLWNASWMAFNRGAKGMAIALWTRAFLRNMLSRHRTRRKWLSLLIRYLTGRS
jgi:glycosyltransferase involved in cell wall biosynthesis